jgi:hypothetical protein
MASYASPVKSGKGQSPGLTRCEPAARYFERDKSEESEGARVGRT